MSGLESGPTFIGLPATPPASSAGTFGLLPVLFCAGAIWLAEMWQRGERAAAPGRASPCAPECRQLLRDHFPEAAGLTGCVALAAALLLRGDNFAPIDPADIEAWSQIKAAWPMLTTADSLIAMQAMMRVPPLLSALLRSGASRYAETERASPMAGGPAALALCAAICRVTLLWQSPHHRLDGPMGGWPHVVFELVALPALLLLSRGALSRLRRAVSLATTLAVLAWVAARHRLAFAEDNPALDALLTLGELLELAAAALCLAGTAAAGGGGGFSASLVHAALPLQQGLSAYYWLVAFKDEPGLAGEGQPLQLLQFTGAAQVGVYLLAAVLHFAFRAEEHSV